MSKDDQRLNEIKDDEIKEDIRVIKAIIKYLGFGETIQGRIYE